MKYIITIIATTLVWVIFFNISISPLPQNVKASKVEVDVYGDVQRFDYQNMTCLTWKNGYGGGMSCFETELLN